MCASRPARHQSTITSSHQHATSSSCLGFLTGLTTVLAWSGFGTFVNDSSFGTIAIKRLWFRTEMRSLIGVGVRFSTTESMPKLNTVRTTDSQKALDQIFAKKTPFGIASRNLPVVEK